MPRSQCENENVQFVQELAEVDGPFESPININYRDLTKLELPSLCWNRSETCPHKMKITNTGHTVIISGKWKCERPYLTGGPLTGKYVFSQIHFHWGQDDCKGSEHQVCGEGFPLEMHVAHFKTEYLSQENALKEKDGMVVVAYLFKLQSEPNPALKKILSLLPSIQQPCTSQSFEPRPLMSLVNPFTDDYFMYWGSVITPTCAHILLWLICREPFGISREQVEEFRKIMDSSQHPICKNSRDIQPLHKRNVFHVNACRDLDNPLLPIKQMLGCYCKGSEANLSFKSANFEEPPAHECSCPVYFRNQEEIEGTAADNNIKCHNLCHNMKGAAKWDSSLSGSAYLKQYVYVQNAIITPAPILAKKFESELIKKVHYPLRKQIKSEDNMRTNFVTQSCCFFPMEKINQIKTRPERRKNREKKKSNSFRAFTNILHSLETLKKHTFKKLKEIDAINQEIKGLKSFCHNAEDKRWLRRIEKVMTTQKQFTIKKSQNCFGELKKLAKECNFDKFFDNKQLPATRNYQKIMQIKNTENGNTNPALPCPDAYEKKPDGGDKLAINQATKFSLKAQKLIQSFFEDIKDNDDLQKTVHKNLLLKKIGSVENKEAGDSKMVSKGFITQKMFVMGNLGDRFFTEVTTEVDTEEEKVEEVIITVEESLDHQESEKSEKKYNIREVVSNKKDSVISLHKGTELPKRNTFENYCAETENQLPAQDSLSDSGTSGDENLVKSCAGKKFKRKNTIKKPLENYLKKLNELTEEKFQTELNNDETLARMWYSNSNLLTDSTETQSMFVAKFHQTQSKSDLSKRKSLIAKVSSKKVFGKAKVKNFSFEGHYLKKKKRSKNTVLMSSCDLSSTSRETAVIVNKSKSKRLMKAQLKLAIEKLVKSGSSESELECKIVSPKRKKLKLETKKKNVTPTENVSPQTSKEMVTDARVQTVTQSTDVSNEEKAVGQTTTENERSPESVGVEAEPLEKYREAVTQTATSTVELKLSKNQQFDSKTKIIRTASAESNHLVKLKLEKSSQEDEELAKAAEEIPKSRIKKVLVKNKSLTSLNSSPRFFSKTPQRLFVENIDSRRKCSIDPSDLEKIGTPLVVDSPKKLQDPPKEPEEEFQAESTRNVSEAKPNSAEVKCEADTLKTAVKQVDEEPRPPNQIQREKSKIPLVRKRYGFSGRERKEPESPKQKPIEEKPKDHLPAEPEKSLTNDKGKDDEERVQNDEPQTGAFLSSAEKNCPSGSISAESSNSLSKPLKRKNKKRPSVSKRSSKHFIRKNSLRTRKPNKVESKSSQQNYAPDEEQVKSARGDSDNEREPHIENNIDKETMKNVKIGTENAKEPQVKKAKGVKEKEGKQGAARIFKKPEGKIPQLKQDKRCTTALPEVPKEKPASPKPTHNFIKRNKQMAGKYKRGPSPVEKPSEAKPIEPRPIPTTKKPINTLPKERRETHVDLAQLDYTKPETSAGNTAEAKEKRTKIPKSVGKPEKTQEKPESSEAKGADGANQHAPENLYYHSSEVALQKIPPASTRFLPAYMMTSELPPPIEIVQNQQKQMNRYLLNANVEYAPDMLKENLKKDKNCDFLYKKDLEYLLTLQRCLYGDMSTSIEKSMNYVKTLLSQEYNGAAATVLGDSSANDSFDYYEPLHYSDSCNSGIVLIEMSDFLDSSTSNSDLSGYFKRKQLDTLSQQLKNKIYISKGPQDSGDPGIVNPIINHNSQEEWHSDSNYDCQIFITLSANSNETEGGSPSQTTTEEISSGTQEVTAQSRTYLERNSSQSFTLKQQRKKRKENEISAEMKQKLLEILETEIKREMGVECSISTETPNETQRTHHLEDPESNQRSQSTGSLDNMEVLAQISETMRQYLSSLKDSKVPRSTEDAE